MEARDNRHNAVAVGLILSLLGMVFLSFQSAGQSLQLGGWVSSTLFQQTGNPDSQILIAQNGQPDSFQIFATSPAMVTGSATGSTYTPDTPNSGTVTLHGTVSSLNGMPRATVGFRYGYSSNNLSFNTSTVTVNAAGAYQVVLTGFDQTQTVYFQAIGVTDGIAYGIGSVFTITRTITPFTGFEPVMLVTPLIIWAAIITSMVLLFYTGIKHSEGLDRYISVSLALVMLIFAIFLFPIVVQVINQIRIM